MITLHPVDIMRILPEIVLFAFAVLIMVLEPFVGASHKKLLGWVGLVGILAGAAAVSCLFLYPWPGMGPAFGGAVAADEFGLYFIYLFLLVAALVILGSLDYLDREHDQHGEYYALVLMGTVGMCFMAASTDLIMIFLALEISSISTYILVGYRRGDLLCNEASLKYFLLGSFATAFFLYGIAFVYGLTGTTNLMGASAKLGQASQWPAFTEVALILVFVGLAFKLSAAPFQVWAPDVYQGAPAPVTAFLSVGPKAAAFGSSSRISGKLFLHRRHDFLDSLDLRRSYHVRGQPSGAVAVERQTPAGVFIDRSCGLCVRWSHGRRFPRNICRHVLPGGLCIHERGSFPADRAPGRRRGTAG